MVLVAAGVGPSHAAPPGLAIVPLDGRLCSSLADGDQVEVTDLWGRPRVLGVVAAGEGTRWPRFERATWLASGATLRGPGGNIGTPAIGRVGPLPPAPRALHLHAGDTLVLTADLPPAPLPEPGAPALVGCTLGQVFDRGASRPPHRIRRRRNRRRDRGRAERRRRSANHPGRGARREAAGRKVINLPPRTIPDSAPEARALPGLARRHLDVGASRLVLSVGCRAVVLDSSWASERWRALARDIAERTYTDIVELCCVAPPGLAARRIRERIAVGGDPSDATPDIAAETSFAQDPCPRAAVVDTSGGPAEALVQTLALIGQTPRAGRGARSR